MAKDGSLYTRAIVDNNESGAVAIIVNFDKQLIEIVDNNDIDNRGIFDNNDIETGEYLVEMILTIFLGIVMFLTCRPVHKKVWEYVTVVAHKLESAIR